MKVFSKREVLAQTSKIFYPLSLCSPVMVNTKIPLRKLWSLKLNWDEEIPDEIKNNWSDIAKELVCLHNISYQKHAEDIDSPLKLYLFCDASPQTSEFAASDVQNPKISNNIFKSKGGSYETSSLKVDFNNVTVFWVDSGNPVARIWIPVLQYLFIFPLEKECITKSL